MVVVVSVLCLVKVVRSIEGGWQGNVSMGGEWDPLIARQQWHQSRKRLTLYLSISYIGNLWPKKISIITTTLKRFINPNSCQTRKNNGPLWGNIPIWCLVHVSIGKLPVNRRSKPTNTCLGDIYKYRPKPHLYSK